MSVALSDYGNLHLIFGPMFSGKSTEGIRRIRQYAVLYSSKVILCVKFSGDNRYTEKAKVSTHDRTELKASSCSSLDELGEDWRKYKAIFIPSVANVPCQGANELKNIFLIFSMVRMKNTKTIDESFKNK